MPVASSELGLDELDLIQSICRESFEDFVKNFWEEVPGAGELIWNWHLGVFCDELQKIAERVFRNEPKEHDVICNVSPGTSKSTIWSILFPAWIWTRMPEARILTASHTDSLVMDLSNKARHVIKSAKYTSCFPGIELRSDQDTKGYYANTAGGDRYTCTVAGKSPMGFHAHFQIVDDPIDPKKALSEAEIISAKDFMLNILPTRKVNKRLTVMCLVMQRLGREDPTAVLLENSKKRGASKIRHICLPAELIKGDDGSYLLGNISPPELAQKYINGLMDPERLGRDVLDEARANLGAYGYAGQFEQSPIPLKGGMFKPAWFLDTKWVKAAPYDCKRVRYWDRAATQDGGCGTAGTLMAYDGQNFFIEHCEWGQWESDERNSVMRSVALRDRAKYGPKHEPIIRVEREGGSSGRDAWKSVARALVGFNVLEDAVTGDKDTRAEPLAAQMAAGNVMFVVDGTWDFEGYKNEFLLFRPEPGVKRGRFKDRVDSSCLVAGTKVLTLAGEKLIEQIKAGDLVWTRKGPKEVLWAGQSGTARELVSVFLSNGRVLEGTKEHRVWILGLGYISLGSLQADSLMWDSRWIQNDCAKVDGRKLFSTEASLISEGRRGVIFSDEGEQNAFTRQYGNTTTEVFPVAIKYITRTKTKQITTLRILNVSHVQSMTLDTLIEEYGKGSKNIWREFVPWLLSGIDRKKEEDGIVRMPRALGRNECLESTLVRGVGASCSQSVLELGALIDGARQCVLRDTQGFMDCEGSIKRNVQRVSELLREQKELGFVQRVVPASGGGTDVPVYDLCVRDTHEFFASGVLVHNSGAFNLLVGARREAGIHVLPSGKNTKGSVRFVICNREQLLTTIIEERTLLISIKDPAFGEEVMSSGERAPGPNGSSASILRVNGAGQEPINVLGTIHPDRPLLHGLNHLLDSVTLEFLDIDPKDFQDKWDVPIIPWGKLPQDLVITKQQAKSIWTLLLKKRDLGPDVIVFQDEGDKRALSIAYAVCDLMRLERNRVIYCIGKEEAKMDGPAPNGYVYDVVKQARGMVI